VIVQVKYRALPGHAGSRAEDDHFIVVRGTVGTDFIYSDPLGFEDDAQAEEISETDLTDAMSMAGAAGAGFALVQPRS
jgi:hypothetical protein